MSLSLFFLPLFKCDSFKRSAKDTNERMLGIIDPNHIDTPLLFLTLSIKLTLGTLTACKLLILNKTNNDNFFNTFYPSQGIGDMPPTTAPTPPAA